MQFAKEKFVHLLQEARNPYDAYKNPLGGQHSALFGSYQRQTFNLKVIAYLHELCMIKLKCAHNICRK